MAPPLSCVFCVCHNGMYLGKGPKSVIFTGFGSTSNVLRSWKREPTDGEEKKEDREKALEEGG